MSRSDDWILFLSTSLAIARDHPSWSFAHRGRSACGASAPGCCCSFDTDQTFQRATCLPQPTGIRPYSIGLSFPQQYLFHGTLLLSNSVRLCGRNRFHCSTMSFIHIIEDAALLGRQAIRRLNISVNAGWPVLFGVIARFFGNPFFCLFDLAFDAVENFRVFREFLLQSRE